MRALHDKNGLVLVEGDEVVHDDGIRPTGTFCIGWDDTKHGYVLDGVGKDKEFWLREWCQTHVAKIV